MPKKSTTSRKWLTVRQTARRLGETEEAVRRMIRAGDLPAQKATSSARAPWVVDALALEDQIAEDEQLAKRRARMAGVVVGYGEDFHRQVAEAHPDTTVDGSTKLSEELRARDGRFRALEQLDDVLRVSGAYEAFESAADQADADEARARAIAAEYVRRERILRRAHELVDDELGPADS